MLRIKWAWCAAAITIFTFSASPVRAQGLDPYLFKTLIGRVYFEYQRHSEEQSGTEQVTEVFTQTYSLDFRSNLLSRRLIIYDLGLAFTDTAQDSQTTEQDRTLLDYYLRTTLLPLSPIPLTLYGSQSVEEIEGAGARDLTKTVYGLNWFIKTKTLPTTTLQAESTERTGTDQDNLITFYKIDLKKDLGMTKNHADFTYTLTDDRLREESDTKEYVANVRNETDISKSTRFFFGALRSELEYPARATDGRSLAGLSASIISSPSIDFRQNHRYTYYQNKTGTDTTTGDNYSGDMGYRFTDKLTGSLSLVVAHSETESPTSPFESDNVSGSGTLDYSPTKELTLSEEVSYSNYFTNSPNVTLNVGDRETLRVKSRARYIKPLSWAHLHTSYAIGYVEDEALGFDGGAGIEQNAFLSLTNIDVNRYAGFNAGGAYDYTEGIAGDLWERRTQTNLGAFNKVWKQYALMRANFEKSSSSAWINVLRQKTEKYNLNIESTYWRNTRIGFDAERLKMFNEISGFTTTDSVNTFVNHNRVFWGGILDLLARYQLQSTEYTAGFQDISTATFSARFKKRLRLNLFWLAFAQHIRSTTEGVSESYSNITNIENSLFYQLRAWSLSLEHRYAKFDETNRDLTDNTIILKASRSFIRIF